MSEIITQAPIQARMDTVETHERIFPLLVAEVLNNATELATDQPATRIDYWNKIALAMMEGVVEELGYGTVGTVIQGIDSVANTIPYAQLMRPSTTRYQGIGLVPRFSATQVSEVGAGFYGRYLPLLMVSQPGNLADEQALAYQKEWSKGHRKVVNCDGVLEAASTEGMDMVEITDPEREYLRQIARDIAAYDTRKALLGLREFVFERLSKRYVNEIRENGGKMDIRDREQIRRLTSLVYGE